MTRSFPHIARILSLAVLAGLFLVCPSSGQTPRPFSVIAYFRPHATDLTKYDFDRLTHICYSFLHLKEGKLVVRGPRDSMAIRALVSLKQQHPALKVLISFGGWGGCEPCSEVFSTPEGRRTFAASVKTLLQTYDADGLDVDWEYPAVEGYPGHRYIPEDKENFTLLMKELRTAFGEKYELSFAAGAFLECLRASVDWRQVMPLVNRVHLMTYDFVNGYSTTTGHHTSLFSTLEQPASTDNAVRFLDSVGVSRSQIVIGAAFYARIWENVQNVNNGLYQPGKFSRYLSYREFDTFFGSGNFSYRWDSTAQAPYRYDPEKHLFATFDDVHSISLKTQYAIEKNLGGIMFWELTGDAEKNGLLETITRVRQSP